MAGPSAARTRRAQCSCLVDQRRRWWYWWVRSCGTGVARLSGIICLRVSVGPGASGGGTVNSTVPTVTRTIGSQHVFLEAAHRVTCPTDPVIGLPRDKMTDYRYSRRMTQQEGGSEAHRYEGRCHWSGSTGVGYEAYSRAHTASAPPALSDLRLSSDAHFHGDPSLLNPEQLLVIAASSCQLLSFLAVAARAKIDVLGYVDHGVGVMAEDDPPMRLTSISLRPTIRVAAGTSEDSVKHLVKVAHRECFIANSLRTEVDIEATVIVDAS